MLQFLFCVYANEKIHFCIYFMFRASLFRRHFIWFHQTISQINRINGTVNVEPLQVKLLHTISTTNELLLSLSLYLFGRFVRKNSYTKDMFWVSLFCFVSFKCVAVAVAIAVVASVSHSQRDECAFFSVLLLVFGIVFTFNAHRSSIRDHFSCYWIFFVYIIRSSLSYSFTLALSLCFNAPAIQPLFICFTLFVYLYLCT